MVNKEGKNPVDIKPMCRRVIVNSNGLALPPGEAFHRLGVLSKVIFERDDGWTLGAPLELERVAVMQWAKHWVAFRRFPGYERLPISQYEIPASSKK